MPSSLLFRPYFFVGLVQRYNALQLDRERQLMSSTPTNPVVLTMDQQLAGIRSDLLSNLASLKKRYPGGDRRTGKECQRPQSEDPAGAG